jgi:carbonic anhydrase
LIIAVGVLRKVIFCGHTYCGVMRGALNPQALDAYPNVTAWLRYAKLKLREEPEPSAECPLVVTEDIVIAQLKNLRSHPTVAARLQEETLPFMPGCTTSVPGAVTAYNEASRTFETRWQRNAGGECSPGHRPYWLVK